MPLTLIIVVSRIRRIEIVSISWRRSIAGVSGLLLSLSLLAIAPRYRYTTTTTNKKNTEKNQSTVKHPAEKKVNGYVDPSEDAYVYAGHWRDAE